MALYVSKCSWEGIPAWWYNFIIYLYTHVAQVQYLDFSSTFWYSRSSWYSRTTAKTGFRMLKPCSSSRLKFCFTNILLNGFYFALCDSDVLSPFHAVIFFLFFKVTAQQPDVQHLQYTPTYIQNKTRQFDQFSEEKHKILWRTDIFWYICIQMFHEIPLQGYGRTFVVKFIDFTGNFELNVILRVNKHVQSFDTH